MELLTGKLVGFTSFGWLAAARGMSRVFVGRGGVTIVEGELTGTAESPHAGFGTFLAAALLFGATVLLLVEEFWFSTAGGALVRRARICV